MLLRLLLLFTIVPLVELYLLIRLGTYIGAADTVAIVIGTGVVGGLLARSQGLAVVHRIRTELNQGRVPAESLFDGLLILISGAMLITPGLLTDGLGLFFSHSVDQAGFQILAQKESSGESCSGRDTPPNQSQTVREPMRPRNICSLPNITEA